MKNNKEKLRLEKNKLYMGFATVSWNVYKLERVELHVFQSIYVMFKVNSDFCRAAFLLVPLTLMNVNNVDNP